MPDAVPAHIQHAPAIGEPAHPAWAELDPWRQVARLAAHLRDDEDLAADQPAITPFTRNVGDATSIRRPCQRRRLPRELGQPPHRAAHRRSDADLAAIPIGLAGASRIVDRELLAVRRPGVLPDGQVLWRYRRWLIARHGNRPEAAMAVGRDHLRILRRLFALPRHQRDALPIRRPGERLDAVGQRAEAARLPAAGGHQVDLRLAFARAIALVAVLPAVA